MLTCHVTCLWVINIVPIGINIIIIGAQDEVAVFAKRRTGPSSGKSGVPWKETWHTEPTAVMPGNEGTFYHRAYT